MVFRLHFDCALIQWPGQLWSNDKRSFVFSIAIVFVSFITKCTIYVFSRVHFIQETHIQRTHRIGIEALCCRWLTLLLTNIMLSLYFQAQRHFKRTSWMDLKPYMAMWWSERYKLYGTRIKDSLVFVSIKMSSKTAATSATQKNEILTENGIWIIWCGEKEKQTSNDFSICKQSDSIKQKLWRINEFCWAKN